MTTPSKFESFTRAVIDALNDKRTSDWDKLFLIEDAAIEHGFVLVDDNERSSGGGPEYFVP